MKKLSLEIVHSCQGCPNNAIEMLHLAGRAKLKNYKVKVHRKDSVFVAFCTETGTRIMSEKDEVTAFNGCPLPPISDADFIGSKVADLIGIINAKHDGFTGQLLCKGNK